MAVSLEPLAHTLSDWIELITTTDLHSPLDWPPTMRAAAW
ncbi:hypothetical protein KL86DES1_21573 [uncultured Desulfovibrio sp.]|uniref:Uncharacterized protein n=1 Tax=uncultured Desulfovibrio sp. TaxID=167968 RepID=A0A212L8I9_9BACT|nr:hypothetical protein KL86DES1_21573 [uncultured Desulfovibrio sp.]VZH34474.1 conserved protein of unknown function [Desulfovibrio sp. 86]